MLHRLLIPLISADILEGKEKEDSTQLRPKNPAISCFTHMDSFVALLFHSSLCLNKPDVCALASVSSSLCADRRPDRTNKDRGWSPKALRRRTSLESSSALFEPHSPTNPPTPRVPQPVPWPFRLLIRVRRLKVVFFCSKSLYLSRCNPRSLSQSGRKWCSLSLCSLEERCSGHELSGILRAH